MGLHIEHTIREHLALLSRSGCTVTEFVDAIGRLSRSSTESQHAVSTMLAALRASGELSEELVRRTAPFAVNHPRAESREDSTTDLGAEAAANCHPHADAGTSIAIGQVLRDRYVIGERIGTGGKGAVFKALDRYRAPLPEAHQYVALKILHSCAHCSEQSIVNLRRELHCAQVLSHRNIVNVFELDRDGDIVFFTMELLDGEPLSTVLERMQPATMRRSQAWQIIRQLGAGLEHAHERGVVHGDLKPRNILFTRSGELRILDFGSAHTFVRSEPLPGRPDFAPVSGTAAYASCELLEGRAADPRDDLYALACICYELLAGHHPFYLRPATLARNFAVSAARPRGLTGRQWRTLQAGLSWHRAGRSMGVGTWLRKLTVDVADDRTITPLHDLTPTDAPRTRRPGRLAAVYLAAILTTVVSIALLLAPAVVKPPHSSASTASAAIKIPDSTPGGTSAATPAARAGTTDADGRPAVAKPTLPGSRAAAVTARPALLRISVDTHQVKSGDRFVEIRVRRSQIRSDGSFTWWTEPATAKQGVDYVPQAKATQTFPAGGRSTRFYVKLLPDSLRSQRNYFYVAIAQPGRNRSADKIIRSPVWLPIDRDQLQARR